MHRFLIVALSVAVFGGGLASADDHEDPYLWLEEVEGEKALKWVEERSAMDTDVLESVPEFGEIHQKTIEIYTSDDRIPAPSIRGSWIYNYWRDTEHVRGIWRRTFLDEYLKAAPSWETVLDLDALAEAEEHLVIGGEEERVVLHRFFGNGNRNEQPVPGPLPEAVAIGHLVPILVKTGIFQKTLLQTVAVLEAEPAQAVL